MARGVPGRAGASAALVGVPLAAAEWVHGPLGWLEPRWLAACAALACVAALLASVSIGRRPRVALLYLALAAAGLIAVTSKALLRSPSLTLAVSLSVMSVLVWTAPRRGPLWLRRAVLYSRARGAALAAVVFWLTSLLAARHTVLSMLALGSSFAIAWSFVGVWAWQSAQGHPRRVKLITLLFIAALLGAAVMWGRWLGVLSIVAMTTLLAALLLPRPEAREDTVSIWDLVLGGPERLLAVTFAGLCTLGALLLMLPLSGAESPLAPLDAAFTAVSAVCVTGLAVVDTPVAFSRFGQAMILVLIQLGGIGIMAFSTAAMRFLGRRMSLRYEGAVAGLIGTQDRSRLFQAIQGVLIVTFAMELAGATLLATRFFAHGDSIGIAVWRGVFTAVSAFCNAGFALQSDGLVQYQADAFVLHTVALLIVTGGISPLAVLALPRWLTKVSHPAPAQYKLALAMTAILLLIGFVFIAVSEWNSSLAHLPLGARLHNAWFQSVTLRTAGFNSIDMARLAPATISLMIVWMFIGGSPGSTAGGIKTTTVGVLALTVLSTARGYWTTRAFARMFHRRTVYRAAAVTSLMGLAAFLALIALQLTVTMPPVVALFEVVSALGTVGLSIGGTAALDDVGKPIIMLCMFAGRVGPLTLFMFLSKRDSHVGWKLPQEDVEVG